MFEKITSCFLFEMIRGCISSRLHHMAKLVVSENFSLFGFLLGRKRLVGSLYVKVERSMIVDLHLPSLS